MVVGDGFEGALAGFPGEESWFCEVHADAGCLGMPWCQVKPRRCDEGRWSVGALPIMVLMSVQELWMHCSRVVNGSVGMEWSSALSGCHFGTSRGGSFMTMPGSAARENVWKEGQVSCAEVGWTAGFAGLPARLFADSSVPAAFGVVG